MPKNIVICCDGTGNEFCDANSNVVKLYSTLVIDYTQAGYYHPGVGTMGAPTARNRFEKNWTRLKGLAFGAGLLDNVADAYRYLMNVYAQGDKIFLFGFSRGAYTVRVLGGVLRMFGLLYPGNEGHIPYMMRMYAQRRRNAGRQQQSTKPDEEFKYTFSRDVELHFVGVWDTVSAIGWIYDPIKLPFTGQNSIIKTARQAISLDERRCFFVPMLWGNPQGSQSTKQVWFAGVHSDVGGSYPEADSSLSKLVLEWMINEAVREGLRIDPQKVLCMLGEPSAGPRFRNYVPPDPNAPEHKSLRRQWWLLELLPHKYGRPGGRVAWRIPLGAKREIPEDSTIFEPALARLPKERLPERYGVEPRVPFRVNEAPSTLLHTLPGGDNIRNDCTRIGQTS